MISLISTFFSIIGRWMGEASDYFARSRGIPIPKASVGEPISSATRGSLNRNLEKLKVALQKRDYPFPSEEISFSMPHGLAADPAVLNASLAALLKFCALNGTIARVTLDPFKPMSKNVPGCVVELGKGRYSVWVDPKYLVTPDVVAAVLAHEVAHIYSGVNDLEFQSSNSGRDHDASEQMTDLLAIALGMGKLIVNGCVLDLIGGKKTFGYLSPKALEYAYHQWQSIRPVRGRFSIDGRAGIE